MRLASRCLAVLAAALVAAGASAAPPGKKVEKKPAAKKPAPSPAPVAVVASKPAPPPAFAPIELHFDLVRFTLANGLRVVLNPDHASPTVGISIVYDVGGRDDEDRKTGFAHLFEHLMFAGSKNVDRGQHAQLVYAHGGGLDATTSFDRTVYYETLPANEIALGLWLEADRMKSLQVTQEAFEAQRQVVREEYRMRIENRPYFVSQLKREELVYQGYAPYGRSAISWVNDLEAAHLEDVAAFHAGHYGPNTAVLSIAGDLDPVEARALVEKYFGGVAKIETKSFATVDLPQQTAQRTATLKDDHARSPAARYGWPIPPVHGPDHDALDVLAEILGGGESARLHQLLVRDKAVAQSASAWTAGRRGPDYFGVDVVLGDGARLADVEKLVEAEIKVIATKPPTDDELVRAKRRLMTQAILEVQSNGTRATRLADQELFFGDASLLNQEPARAFAVTKDDVRRVAEKYLGPLTRTIVETLPPEGEKAAPPKVAAPAVKPTPAAKKPADKKDAKKPAKKGKP